MFYIGIDGGGTKTKFALMDENEKLIGTVEKGTCHFNQVGLQGMKNILSDGINELLKSYNVKFEEIKRACLGLAGYGSVESISNEINKVIKEVFKDTEVLLFNDVHIAHAGALSGKNGIVIIAGTGSIGYSVINNVTKRVGGWGYIIGDEGSAYWIGKKGIEYFSKEADGRLKKGELYNIFKKELSLVNDYDIIKYINEDIKGDRREIAKLAPLCFKAAKCKDEHAINIFKNAGEELSKLINVLTKDFSKEEIFVSYIGGVFKAENLILEPIKENVSQKVKIISPKFQPEIGACLIAKLNKK